MLKDNTGLVLEGGGMRGTFTSGVLLLCFVVAFGYYESYGCLF